MSQLFTRAVFFEAGSREVSRPAFSFSVLQCQPSRGAMTDTTDTDPQRAAFQHLEVGSLRI